MKQDWRGYNALHSMGVNVQQEAHGHRNSQYHHDDNEQESFGKLHVNKQRHQYDPEVKAAREDLSGGHGTGASFNTRLPPHPQSLTAPVNEGAHQNHGSGPAVPSARMLSGSSLRSQTIDESPRFNPLSSQHYEIGDDGIEPWPAYQDQMDLVDSYNSLSNNTTNKNDPLRDQRGMSDASSAGLRGPRTSRTSSVTFYGRTPVPSRTSMCTSRATHAPQSPSIIGPGHFKTAPKALNPCAAAFVSPSRTPAHKELSVMAEENAGDTRITALGGLGGCVSVLGSSPSGSSLPIITPTTDTYSEIDDNTVLGSENVTAGIVAISADAPGDVKTPGANLSGSASATGVVVNGKAQGAGKETKHVSGDTADVDLVKPSEMFQARDTTQPALKKSKKKSLKKKQANNSVGIKHEKSAENATSSQQGSPAKKAGAKAKFGKSQAPSSRPNSQASGGRNADSPKNDAASARPAKKDFFKSKAFHDGKGPKTSWRKNDNNENHALNDTAQMTATQEKVGKFDKGKSKANDQPQAVNSNDLAHDTESKQTDTSFHSTTFPSGQAVGAHQFASCGPTKAKPRLAIPNALSQKKSCPDFTAANGKAAQPCAGSPRGKIQRGNNMIATSSAKNNSNDRKKPAASPKMQFSAMDWPELPASSPSAAKIGGPQGALSSLSDGDSDGKDKTGTDDHQTKTPAVGAAVARGSVWKKKIGNLDVPVTN
ncbi:hypothetical protein MN608_02803 [Microdochium nivale]|nr:hypothetical protein MN608_02803 [Microdochium nivale]